MAVTICDVDEACSLSSGDDAQVVDDAATTAPGAEVEGNTSSKNPPVKTKARSRKEDAQRRSMQVLPEGWVRMQSKSKPGVFFYAHPATGRTQMKRPRPSATEAALYAGLPNAATAASQAVAGAQSGQKHQTQSLSQDDAKEAERLRQEAKAKAKEQVIRKRKQAEAALKEAEARAAAEEAANEKVLSAAREKRHLNDSSNPAPRIIGDLVQEDDASSADLEGSSDDETDEAPKVKVPKVSSSNKHQGKIGLRFGPGLETTTPRPEISFSSSSEESEVVPPPQLAQQEEVSRAPTTAEQKSAALAAAIAALKAKQRAKQEKKKLEKMHETKEEKQKRKQAKKEKKLKKKMKKAKKKMKKAAKLAQMAGGGDAKPTSNNSGSSSSSSSSS